MSTLRSRLCCLLGAARSRAPQAVLVVSLTAAFGPGPVVTSAAEPSQIYIAAERVQAQGSAAPRQIAYAFDTGLFVANRDGSNMRKLVDGSVAGPSWSHDGGWIAYLRVFRDTTPFGAQIEIVSTDGAINSTVVPFQPNPTAGQSDSPYALLREVRWAPDDSAVFYQWTYGSSGVRGIKRLDLKTGVEQELGIAADEFDVAPNDGALVVSYQVGKGTSAGYEIRLVDTHLQGPGEQLLKGSYGRHPSWSPDGRKIIVATDSGFIEAWRNGDIQAFTSVPTAGIRPGQSIAWSPGDDSIDFDNGGDIWEARLDSTVLTPFRFLALGASVPTDPAWSWSG